MTDIAGQERRDGSGVERPAISEENSRFDLAYPQIPLHLSLDSLIAHSSPSSSTISNMPSVPEISQPALEDSWASLAEIESSNDDDLQSENTDVGSLLDVHSSDDIQSISDEIRGHDAESTDEEDLQDTANEQLEESQPLSAATLRAPSLNQLATPATLSHSFEGIYELSGDRQVRLSTVNRPLSEDETRKIRRLFQDDRGEPSRYYSVVQMAILENGLDLNTLEYFKVLFLGRDIEQFRQELQRKLGDALVSQQVSYHNSSPTSVARFHLVPNTFGPGSNPDFADLVAIDKQIDFDCYDRVSSTRLQDAEHPLQLKNSQTRSEIVSGWNGNRFVVTNPRWVAPDLALVCVHTDKEGVMDEQSHLMLSFVERHSIPAIVIRMDRGWHGNYLGSWNPLGLHEKIESRPENSEAPRSPHAAAKVPLDMAAFLNLDSSQLNKHIAYLLSATKGEDVEALSEPVLLTSKSDKQIPSPRLLMKLPPISGSHLKHAFIILWIVGVYVFLGSQLWPIMTVPGPGATSGDVASTSPIDDPSRLTEMRMSSSVAQVFSQAPEKQGQLSHQLLDIATTSDAPTLDDGALHFQVGIAGDHQLLVKLPKVALSRKKRSPLLVSLERKGHHISADVQELFEGVFSVQLLAQDTYGDIEVHLSMTKPQLSEVLTVSFGDRSRFDVHRFKDIVAMAHSGLQTTISSLSTHVKDIKNRTALGYVTSELTLLATGWQRLRENTGWQQLRERMWLNGARWGIPEGLARTSPRLRVSHILDNVNNGVKQIVRESQDRGRQLASEISGTVTNTRATLAQLFDSESLLSQRARTLVPKFSANLKTAQGRAKKLMAGTVGKLQH